MSAKLFATVLTLSAAGLGAWTVEQFGAYQASLDPRPAQLLPRRGVPGKRLLWREVEVPPRPAETDATRAKGAALFAANCAECHGPEGRGDGPAARAFSPPPRNFSTGEYRLRSTATGLPRPEDLYRSISTGFLATRMPGFGWMPAEDRWALVAHVISLTVAVNPEFDPASPIDEDNWKTKNRYQLQPPGESMTLPKAPDVQAASIARGKETFVREGCVKCHGPEGRGDGESADAVKDATGALIAPMDYTRLLTHSKAGADREDIFRVVTTGLQTMPSFAQLPEQDRWDMAAWVHSKADPEEPERAAERPEVKEGRAVFVRNCAGCHGPEGRGDGPALAFLETEPRDLTSGVYKWKSTPVGELPSDEDIERILRHGVPGTAMPAWNLMPEPERASLVKYMKALAPRFRALGRVPRAPVAVPFAPRDLDSKEMVAQGRDLYTKWGCVSCHGATGRGDGTLAPILQDLWGYPVKPRDLAEGALHGGDHPEDTFRVLTVGVEGTPMPPFGAVLTEAERYSLVAFIRALRRHAAPNEREGAAK